MITKPPLVADEDLRQAIFQALADEAELSVFGLRVGVLHNVAHLAGEVPSRALRERAEEVAAGVPGVRGVVNRISAPGAPSPGRTIHIDLTGGEEL